MQLPLQRLINFVKELSFRLLHRFEPFPCCLSKEPLKQVFLDFYLTIFFRVGISLNTSAMRVIFFWQMFKI